MSNERMVTMDKVLGENDFKGLEDEIDSAVDRLFVEKTEGPAETISKAPQPPVTEQPFQMERDFEIESTSVSPPPPPPPPRAAPVLKPLEKMEGQLLSLEWEINRENLGKTKEEVLALRKTLKGSPDVGSVLGLMDKVLDYMAKNEDKIRPPLVKFLMDSKETLKLLMRKEADSELNMYKQLASMGIQARYSCLEELSEAKPETRAPGLPGEIEGSGILVRMEKQIEDLSKKMNLFLGKIGELYQKMDLFLSKGDLGSPLPAGKAAAPVRWVPMNFTVVKVEDRLLGVESDKVYKLFKVPPDHRDRYLDQQIIRLKDFELRLVDLRKVLSVPKGSRRADIKILAVNEAGEMKGLMVDQVLERCSADMETGGKYGDYFMGVTPWTYQERPVTLSILNLKKL